MRTASLRATAVALLAGGLMLPAAALAAPDSNTTGTVVGTVTCGPAEEAPAAHIVVSAEGLNLQTLTSSDGRFTLVGLPTARALTIDAIADPQGSDITSRFNVTVQPGQTLDIGSMDLSVCGQPQAPAPAVDQTSDQAPDVSSPDN